MSNDPNDRDAITAYIRMLGNPYARSQIIGAEDGEQQAELELRPATEAEHNYVRLLGNQYAMLSIAIRDSTDVPAHSPATAGTSKERPVAKATLAKNDFVTGCRRIFRPYIPSVEKGRLRAHHRDFIIRNQNRSPSARYLLIQELSKYDLTVLPGMETRFNREREDLSDHKLKQIERSVLVDRSTK